MSQREIDVSALEGRVAELEAALARIRDCQPKHWFDDGNTGIHYTTGLGFVQGVAEDALAARGDQAAPLQAQVASLRSALNDALRLHHYERECHCPECDRIRAALAGTSDQGWLSPEEATKLQAQVATMRAALSNLYEDAASAEFHLNCECGERCPKHALSESSLPKAEAALAGTGDEVGAVVRSAVELGDALEKLLDSQKYGGGVDESAIDAYTGKVSALREKVTDLLAKQPGVWERD